MPHPIYGDPKHELDEVHVSLWLPTPKNAHVTAVQMLGVAETQRGSLWCLKERWERHETRGGYEASDFVHHAIMVALQDWPTSQQQMEACLIGEGWAQDELPL